MKTVSPAPGAASRLPAGRGLGLAALGAAALLLGACATDYTPLDGASPDETKRSSDLSACRDTAILDDEAKSAAGGFLLGAFYGAAQGAALGAFYGGSAEGAIIGTAAGAAIGFAIGIASGETDVDQCMEGKGWQAS